MSIIPSPSTGRVTQLPLVMIGITTFNRCDILPRAIESAFKQLWENKEVVVLDDASTDGTPQVSSQFSSVTWHRNDNGKGYMENRNRLMRESLAEYYVSLDDDAWFLRGDEITIAIDHFQRDPKLAAIGFDIASPDKPEIRERSEIVPAASYIGCGHILRLSAVKEAGYYTPAPGSYGSEERDLCVRLLDMGYKVGKLPGVHVWHQKEWSQRDWFPLHRSGVCNDLTFTIRRCPFPDVLGVLPYKLFSHLRFALRKPAMLRPTIAGYFLFARCLPQVLCSRKPVARATFLRSSSKRFQ